MSYSLFVKGAPFASPLISKTSRLFHGRNLIKARQLSGSSLPGLFRFPPLINMSVFPHQLPAFSVPALSLFIPPSCGHGRPVYPLHIIGPSLLDPFPSSEKMFSVFHVRFCSGAPDPVSIASLIKACVFYFTPSPSPT